MKTKKIFKLPIALFLFLYFLYLLVSSAPAAWAAWAAHKAVPSLWLNNVEGTLWSGRAKLAQIDMGAESLALGELRWELSPWTLLIAKPCMKFETLLPNQQISGSFCQSVFGQSTLSDFNADLPVENLSSILPVQALGPISLQVLEASFDGDARIESLDARLSWQQARVHNGDKWMSLGSFAAKAKADEQGGVQADVFDLDGPYKSALVARWSAGQAWVVDGTITPQEGADELVVQGLQLLGEDLGDGSYRVQWP
ncbi:type II secretion system protein N [Agaribacterium sp. ZY112]|uniref:type II secretion system protein N n=1 Tax=Agaribacterium sp. ZY112 TaxID=3233574 RepID=UPI0035258D70